MTFRDAGLLAAAAARPQITVFGEDAYPTFEATCLWTPRRPPPHGLEGSRR